MAAAASICISLCESILGFQCHARMYSLVSRRVLEFEKIARVYSVGTSFLVGLLNEISQKLEIDMLMLIHLKLNEVFDFQS